MFLAQLLSLHHVVSLLWSLHKSGIARHIAVVCRHIRSWTFLAAVSVLSRAGGCACCKAALHVTGHLLGSSVILCAASCSWVALYLKSFTVSQLPQSVLQVVHHLFPAISHTHYPAIAPIVMRTCQEYNIPYKVYPTVCKCHLHFIICVARTLTLGYFENEFSWLSIDGALKWPHTRNLYMLSRLLVAPF